MSNNNKNNVTVASDNSSDTNSNKNEKSAATKSNKSDIEVLDQKIVQCINEINHLEHKIQR
jgi:hypothetical protein